MVTSGLTSGAGRSWGQLRSGRGNFRELMVGFAVVLAIGGMLGLLEPSHLTDPSMRGAIEIAITMWAAVACGLLVSHFKHTRSRRDLLFLSALAAAATTDFFFLALPAFANSSVLGRGTGARLGAEMLVAIAFAAVALLPDRELERRGGKPVLLAVAAGLGVVLLGLLVNLLVGGALHRAGQSGLTAAAQHPLRFAVTLVSSELLLISGLTLSMRARGGYRDARLLAGAAYLLCAARLQYLVMPSTSLAWVTPRDGLRLAAYGLLLLAAVRQYALLRRAAAQEAIEAERLRIARDLHDGLAQDLAFIASHSELLAGDLGDEHPVAVAARRALEVSRGAIVDLSASTAPNTAAALHQVADELSHRFGTHVQVTARDQRRDLSPSEREDVLRIAREAVVNAVKHGRATKIDILLDTSGDGPLLRVLDNGAGIAAESASSGGGFGLPAMRARASALGGRLVTRTLPRGGTELELLVF
jgi:signal transduction histidine kinase